MPWRTWPESPKFWLAFAVSSLILGLCWIALAWFVTDREVRNPLSHVAFGIAWIVIGAVALRKAVLLRRGRARAR